MSSEIRAKFLITRLTSGPRGWGELATDHGTPFIRITNIPRNGIELDLSDLVRVSAPAGPERERTRTKVGDVLVSITADVGSVATVGTNAIDGNVSQHVALLRPNLDVCVPRWLAYALKSSKTSYQLEINSYGGTKVGVGLGELANLKLPNLSVEEQRRIADFLDAETVRIDELIRLREAESALVRERVESCVSGAFIVDEAAHRVRLGYLAQVQSGVTVDASREQVGDVVTRPYLRVANVQAGYLKLDAVSEITVPVKMARASTLRAGDVLMTEGGDLDKLGRGTVWRDQIPDCLHQNHVFAVRPSNRLNPEYLALFTRTAYARRYFESTGTKTTNLASTSSSKIRDLRVPLVSKEEQEVVVGRLDDELARASELITALDRQRMLLEEKKRALITAAVTGEFDVSSASGRG